MSRSAFVALIAGLAATAPAAHAVVIDSGFDTKADAMRPAASDTPQRQLSGDAVMKQLAWRGYRDFSRPELVGRTYRIAATDTRGTRIAILVDAYTGVVVHRRRPPSFTGISWFPPAGGR